MANQIDSKLLTELRQQTSILMAGVHLLDAFVEERGGERERLSLAAMYKSLYTLLRTLRHTEFLQQEAPSPFPQALELSQFCLDLCREVGSLGTPLGVDFRWRVEKGPLPITVDRHILAMTLLNLLFHAFDAAGKGGSVEFRCARAEGGYRFSIQDMGVGSPPPRVPREEPSQSSDGVGQGLAYATRSARLLGGTLMLQYGPGRTTAILSLPRGEGSDVIRGPLPDWTGGLSSALVEFAPLLPMESFLLQETE